MDDLAVHPGPALDADAAVLRSAGLKVTRGRLAALRLLQRMPHSDAETLHRHAVTDEPSLSVQSMHNVLTDLTRVGLLRRIEPERSAALYERRVGDNHHHVVCRACGKVADVDCVVGHAPCLAPSDAGGFAIDTAEVVFWGLCADCR